MKKIHKRSDTVIILGNNKYLDEDFLSTPNEHFESHDVWVVGGGLYHDVYGANEKFHNIKNYPFDYIFELHTLESRSQAYIDFLYRLGTPIIMQQEDREANTCAYPLKEIMDKFDTRYFMCTFAYMIALAIHMDYKFIKLYGVNMAFLDDYTQKYNCDFWLGMALGKGITVELSGFCDLLRMPKMYGYEADNTLAVHIFENLRTKISAINKTIDMIDSEIIKEQLREMFETFYKDKGTFMKEIYYRHGMCAPDSFKIKGQQETFKNHKSFQD